MYKCYNIILFDPKNRRAQEGEGQKSEKNRKNKRDKKNKRSKKSKKSYYGNNINLIIGKSNGSKVSVYYHII